MTRMHLASRQGARRRIAPDPGDDWRLHAYCRTGPDPADTWFTEHLFGHALHLCNSHCPVQDQCWPWARRQKWHDGCVVGGRLHTRRRGWIPPNSRWAPKPTTRYCAECRSKPQPTSETTMTDVEELEQVAQELMLRVRDYDPEDNQRWLTFRLPDPADWFRLCFVLACAVPDDRTWRELTAWADGPPVPATAEVQALQPCGTRAAYRRHLAHGEVPCGPCEEANRSYELDRRRAKKGAA